MEAVHGYDCGFVDAVCKDIPTECAICLLILRQPYMVECCGNRFCQACLEKNQRVLGLQCPLCNQEIAKAIADKQLERCLKEKRVYCSNKERGCTWTGKLGQLEGGHLKVNPPEDKLMDGCLFISVLCSQCHTVKVERHKMKDHMKKECPKRIAVCTYCQEYRTAYEDIVRFHHPVCLYIPTPCPKNCGEKPLRKDIATHLAKVCPNNPLPCPFQIVGCTTKLSGIQMESHLSDTVVFTSHLADMKKAFGALKEEIGEKDLLITALRDDIKKNRHDMCMLAKNKDASISTLKDKLAANERHSSALHDKIRHNEQKLRRLNKQVEVYIKESEKKTADLQAKASLVTAFSYQLKEKGQQIEKLQRQSAHDEQTLRQLTDKRAEIRKYVSSLEAKIERMKMSALSCTCNPKEKDQLVEKLQNKSARDEQSLRRLTDKNTELRRYIRSLEDKIDKMKTEVEGEALTKEGPASRLERKIAELQEVIQAQKSHIEELTRTAKQGYGMLSEADKREKPLRDIRDGGSVDETVPSRQMNRDSSKQPSNPPADDSGVLGAAATLGVAMVGVGVASIAAGLLRR